jgi:hypothetical protein
VSARPAIGLAWGVALACAAPACSELAGVRDLHLAAGGAPLEAGVPDAAEDGACGDTRSNGESCGACGHSCRGGACLDGECAPVLVGAVPDTGPVSLAVDGERLFVGISGGQLLAVPVTGGALTSLALPTSLASIAIDATDLFLATDTKVLRCAAKSCALPQAVAEGLRAPTAISTVADDVYFLTDDGLRRAPRTGGTAVVAIAGRPTAYVADAAGITFSRADGISRCPAGGCGAALPTQLVAVTAPGALALEGGEVVFFDGPALRSAPLLEPPALAPARDLAGAGPSAGALVVSAARITWRETGLRVAACARAGGAPKTQVAGDDAPVSELVADATSIYWMTANRRLLRLAR